MGPHQPTLKTIFKVREDWYKVNAVWKQFKVSHEEASKYFIMDTLNALWKNMFESKSHILGLNLNYMIKLWLLTLKNMINRLWQRRRDIQRCRSNTYTWINNRKYSALIYRAPLRGQLIVLSPSGRLCKQSFKKLIIYKSLIFSYRYF